MDATITNHHDRLRAWARGSLPEEAAVELLIQAFAGRFADQGKPWVFATETTTGIHWRAIPEWIGGLSGGERRFMLLTASLAGGVPADLSDVSGLDYELQDLFLDAMRHAGGRRVFNRG